MSITGRIREQLLRNALDRRRRDYSVPLDPARRAELQLESFNAEWQRVLAESPYYRKRARAGELPGGFSSWDEFQQTIPVITRSFLQRHATAIACDSARPEFHRTTGGSTGQPLQIPAWKRELVHAGLDIWLGRSWYGIHPSSRLFLIWGHAHLLGSGLGGWWRARRREMEDALLGYHRYSAYDLQPDAMRRAGARMLRFRPEYVMGYSVALDRFAESNLEIAGELGALGVKLVVAAAESFPAAGSKERLEQMFRCPVAMEYGSVETNLMAHTHPGGGYLTFWRSYFMETVPVAGNGDRKKVVITSLYPRSVPLLRYEIGDEIVLDPECPGQPSVGRFREVAGRCNDYVHLPDGARIHSEAFTHAVRSSSDVKGYQVVQNGDGVSIRILCGAPLSESAERGIQQKLGKIHRLLRSAPLIRVEHLETTIAGKTPMILRS